MALTSLFKTDAPVCSQVPKTSFDSPTRTRATTIIRSWHEHFASLQRVIVARPIHAVCSRSSSSARLVDGTSAYRRDWAAVRATAPPTSAQTAHDRTAQDWKSADEGTGVSVRVDPGGTRHSEKKNTH